MPQVLLLLALSYRLVGGGAKRSGGAGLALGAQRHISTCLCAQTIAFVAMNKVYTVQYFVWYLFGTCAQCSALSGLDVESGLRAVLCLEPGTATALAF